MSAETRAAALAVYTVVLPLAPEEVGHHPADALCGPVGRGPSLPDDLPLLYIAPDRETLLLLDQEAAVALWRLAGWIELAR